jgi:alkylation response protein AidB-like acyl-CoA dehydrogenase
MTQQLEALSASADEAETAEVIEKLKETHATSAGLKAFCTWWCLETIDKCRQACGGHGYSAYNGLANMVSWIRYLITSRVLPLVSLWDSEIDSLDLV